MDFNEWHYRSPLVETFLNCALLCGRFPGKRKGTRAHNQHGREKSHRRAFLRSASPLTCCIAVRPFHFLTAERTSRELPDLLRRARTRTSTPRARRSLTTRRSTCPV